MDLNALLVRSTACLLLLCTVVIPLSPLSPVHDPPLTPHQTSDVPTTALAIASYDIEVTLDAGARTLVAHEVATYLNTTADSLPDLVFHLYLNAFAGEDSIFMQEGGAAHRGYRWDPEQAGWITVTGIRLADGTPLALEEIADGTLARVDLPFPIEPGEVVQVELEFRAQLPRVSSRTGYAGDFFMVGQWFPKLGVWQDGAWNAYPFHANAEFYADFGSYDVAITLPSGYVTGGTGSPIATTDNGDGTQTVRYQAGDVIDFAWTAYPRFEQAIRQVEGVEVLYLYLAEHEWTVERVLAAAGLAISHFGRWYGPYPYSRLTLVDVPDEGRGAGGMEYPTLVTLGAMSLLGVEGVVSKRIDRSLEAITVHEIGHQWWQSLVAFNEAEEPWLDEGFAEYSTARLLDTVYGPDASLLNGRNLKMGYLDTRRLEYLTTPQVPMVGLAWEFELLEYSSAAYAKPALALRTLERFLGEETMLDLMSTFFQRYRFAHPTTEEFRAVAEEVSGQDLSWFFDGLVYGDGVLNYAVTALDDHSATLVRQGDLSIPTEVLVTFADGSTVLEAWDGQEAERILSYPGHPALHSVEIDPERRIEVDLLWADNGLSRRLEVRSWLALVTRLLYNLQNALLALGGL